MPVGTRAVPAQGLSFTRANPVVARIVRPEPSENPTHTFAAPGYRPIAVGAFDGSEPISPAQFAQNA